MLFDLLRLLLIVGVLAFGLAWPIAARLPLAPAEKFTASVVLSLLGVYLFAWGVYVWALPLAMLWALPALGALGLAVGAREFARTWHDTDAQEVIVGQLLVTGWCLGWLSTIVSYTGGGWSGDWFEHWQRTRFFLERLPHGQLFLSQYTLTARPPLVNVVTAAFLSLTRANFAHYQLSSTLLASLVFLPASLLARRFGRDARTIALCAALFVVSPLLVQNATFAWTKLPAAFFTLAGLYFFLRAQERGAPLAAALLCGASLAAALLAHYSAGPYAVMLALGWIGLGWAQRYEHNWQRSTGIAIAVGAAVLATWFGWALAVYGSRETFFSNSSVIVAGYYPDSQLAKIALNLRDTIVPYFLRSLDTALIAQRSPWGRWSDWFFQCYQTNLPLACGSVAWIAIGRELVRAHHTAAKRDRIFWGSFVVGVILLGVATHGARDTWGLAHVALQALVLLGVAFLAARWGELGRLWRIALVMGAAVDLSCGIVLHGGVQSLAFDNWFAAGRPAEDILTSYNEIALLNLNGKTVNHLAFFSDAVTAPLVLVLALLAAILMLAVVRAWPRGRRVR